MAIQFEEGKLIRLTRTDQRGVIELTVLKNDKGLTAVVDQHGHVWTVTSEDVPVIGAGGNITKTLRLGPDGRIGAVWKDD